MRLRAKAPRSVAGDAYEYRIPLGGIVVGPLSMSGLRAKTLVCLLRLSDCGALCRLPLAGVFLEAQVPTSRGSSAYSSML